MAVTVITRTRNTTGDDMEMHVITWGAGADVTVELATGLSQVTGHFVSDMYGANAGHAVTAAGSMFVDEVVDADGNITVPANGNLTVSRFRTDAAATLTTQVSHLILFGRS